MDARRVWQALVELRARRQRCQVACPVSLVDGVHNVTFVGVFGEQVESAPIELLSTYVSSVASLVVNDDIKMAASMRWSAELRAPGTNALRVRSRPLVWK